MQKKAHPEKTPNLGSFSKIRFDIAHIFLSTVLHPVAEMANKRMHHPMQHITIKARQQPLVCHFNHGMLDCQRKSTAVFKLQLRTEAHIRCFFEMP